MDDSTAEALRDTLISSSEKDRNGETANVVDAVFGMSRALEQGFRHLGLNDAGTPMGAIEAHAKAVLDTGERVSGALGDIAEAIRELANAVRERE